MMFTATDVPPEEYPSMEVPPDKHLVMLTDVPDMRAIAWITAEDPRSQMLETVHWSEQFRRAGVQTPQTGTQILVILSPVMPPPKLAQVIDSWHDKDAELFLSVPHTFQFRVVPWR